MQRSAGLCGAPQCSGVGGKTPSGCPGPGLGHHFMTKGSTYKPLGSHEKPKRPPLVMPIGPIVLFSRLHEPMSTDLGKTLGLLCGALILAILGKVSLPKAIQSLPITTITVLTLLDQTQAYQRGGGVWSPKWGGNVGKCGENGGNAAKYATQNAVFLQWCMPPPNPYVLSRRMLIC